MHFQEHAIKAMAVQYRETAEWADGDSDCRWACWSESAIEEAKDVVVKFVSDAGDLLDGIHWDLIGHNIWLSRNHHGTGFWDRGWGEVGDKLHKIAQQLGPRSLYVENDEIFFDIG